MYNVRLNPFSMSGPFAVLMTYLTELHGRQYRQRIMMMVGIMFSLATLSLPGLAMGILPQSWDTNILGLSCKYNAPLFCLLSACLRLRRVPRRTHSPCRARVALGPATCVRYLNEADKCVDISILYLRYWCYLQIN